MMYEKRTPAFDLRWHTFMRIKAPHKIPRVVYHMQRRLYHAVELLSSAPYAPGSQLVYVELRSPLAVDEMGAAIFRTLYLAQRVGKHWEVTGPRPRYRDNWYFMGQAAHGREMSTAGGWEFRGQARKHV